MEDDEDRIHYAINIDCIDDVPQDDLIGAIASGLRRKGQLVGTGRYQFGSDILVAITYDDRSQSGTSGRLGTGYLQIGRMQAKGYTETGNTIRIDLPLTKYDINKRYDHCISQIASNVRLIITQLYCLSSRNPLEFYQP